jgi:hypothetical protein
MKALGLTACLSLSAALALGDCSHRPPPPVPAAAPPPPVEEVRVGSCAAEPIRTTGKVQYVCDCDTGAEPGCVPGDDASSGATSAKPKRTWAAVTAAWSRMGHGDTIALCKGGAWRGAAGLPLKAPGACSAAGWSGLGPARSTCDLRDYVPPTNPRATAKPRITFLRTGLFTWNTSEYPTRYEGYRILNLAFAVDHFASDLDHIFIWAFGNYGYFDVCNVDETGFDTGFRFQQGNHGTSDHIAIRESRLLRNGSEAIAFCASDLQVLDNVLEGNGRLGNNRVHSVYLSSCYQDGAIAVGRRIRLAGNTISRSVVNDGADPAHPPQPGCTHRCGGSPIVIHGQYDGLTLEDNVIEEEPGTACAGCWGIDAGNGGYPYPTIYRNVVIRRNRLLHLGGLSIGAQGEGTIVENNLVVNDQGGAGISLPRDVDASNVPGSTPFERAIVRNNTVYYLGNGGPGVEVKGGGSGHVVASNAVAHAAGSGRCFDLPLADRAYALVADNACGPGGAWGTAPVRPGTVTSAPRFTNPAALDFTLQPGSPLASGGSAHPLGHAANDLAGRGRDPSCPGVGAYAP